MEEEVWANSENLLEPGNLEISFHWFLNHLLEFGVSNLPCLTSSILQHIDIDVHSVEKSEYVIEMLWQFEFVIKKLVFLAFGELSLFFFNFFDDL